MHKVLLLGAGKIGRAVASFLHASGDYDVLAADSNSDALTKLKQFADVQTQQIDATSERELELAMQNCDSVLSALSYSFNPLIAKVATATATSYFDLTEDIETTRLVRSFANGCQAGCILMPQCGLAPGFISIAAWHLAQKFDSLDEVKMRVGALPQFPSNLMKYNLTWSTDGLINEYCNPCEAIHQGQLMEVLPMEGLEHFSLDGVRYEAFNTSGGLGSLCESLDGKVRELNYRTIRYLGHRDLMQLLLQDLRMTAKREQLKQLLEDAVPVTYQDVVIAFVTVSGRQNGQFTQISDARKVYHQEIDGSHWGAIQITTAAGLCAALDLHVTGRLPDRGFVRQEDIRFDDFLTNRFGSYYAAAADTKFDQTG